MLRIQKLVKRKINLRMALVGPTGSGKTFTALTLARELTPGRILVVDSERSSADRYADFFNGDGRFDHLVLPDFSPDTYVEALELAHSEGYDCAIVDSLSHAWMGKEGALEQVDKLAKRNGGGGSSFNAWREVTPMHNRLVDALLTFPGHLICTMRVKTEYVVESVNGKSVPRKVGLSPVQREGVEYEFDIVGDLDEANNLIVTKTRLMELGGAVIPRPGAKLAQQIRAWVESGAESAPTVSTSDGKDDRALATEFMTRMGIKGDDLSEIKSRCSAIGLKSFEFLAQCSRDGLASVAAVLRRLADAEASAREATATKSEPAEERLADATTSVIPKSGSAFGVATADWPSEAAFTETMVGNQPGMIARHLENFDLPKGAESIVLDAYGIPRNRHASRGAAILVIDWFSRADEDARHELAEAAKLAARTLAADAAAGAS
jgi:energy-coupling factor transporter ATP-binding protein EcfA2